MRLRQSFWLAGVAGLALPGIASAAIDAASGTADTIIVTGQRPANEGLAGTKTGTSLVETPQSISVITRDDLDARAVTNLNQALLYTAGITPDTRGANGENYDLFKLRGFDAPQYLDGLKIFSSPTGYAATQVDISRLDRIEVVKGPASVLYGASSPGGLIAMSSKLPGPAESFGSVEASYGSFNLFRLDGDSGGSLSPDGTIRYRVSGSINGADSQQNYGSRRRYTISPAVTFGAGTDTTVTLLGNYSHDPKNGNYGSVPLSGSVDPNPNGRISQKFNDGEPGLTDISRNQGSLTYLATHDFGNGWVVRANGRYQDVTAKIQAVYGTGLLSAEDTDQSLFGRASYRTKEHMKNYTFDNQLTGTVATGAISHQLLFGVDYQATHSTEAYGFGNATDIDVYNPVYGTTVLPAEIADYPSNGRYNVHQNQTGIYAQDQISFGDFRLTASGRYDWAKGHQLLTSNFGGGDDTKKDRKFTYRVGGLYAFDFGLSPYVSYSTSFQPQASTVTLANGSTGLADPSLGKQIEGGLKYQPPGTSILLTGAYFKIDQTNVVVSNPVTYIGTQSGKVRSEGYEFEAKVPLVKGLNATANFSHQKVRTIDSDNDPLSVGRPLIGVGKENAGLFADYTLQNGSLQGLGFGGGVRYVGGVYGGYIANATNTAARYVYTRSYTLFDASLSYDLSRVSERMRGVRVAVNAANLLNKRYVSSCYINGSQWCWYGQRRTVQGTIGFRW